MNFSQYLVGVPQETVTLINWGIALLVIFLIYSLIKNIAFWKLYFSLRREIKRSQELT